MKLEDFEIISGENEHQSASFEKTDKTIDYTTSKKLSFLDILSITQGLNIISEFFDVNAAATVSNTGGPIVYSDTAISVNRIGDN